LVIIFLVKPLELEVSLRLNVNYFIKTEASHDLTGVKVAVKIINKKKMKKKNMISKVIFFLISKVKREIKILKFINHPNIIKLYEVLDTTNDIFVIMELASKGELYDFIQNN